MNIDWEKVEEMVISNPASKAKSVVLTEEVAKRSKELFQKYFSVRA